MSGGEHTISFEEALKIEQARNKADNEEREKRESGQGLPQKDEKFSSEDIARQIHAFMCVPPPPTQSTLMVHPLTHVLSPFIPFQEPQRVKLRHGKRLRR